MHEMGLAAEIARLATEEANAAGAKRVTALHLRIGEWSGVEVESLRFALQVLAEDTLMAGCRVEVEVLSPLFECARCGKRYTAASHFEACSHCSELGGRMLQGDELTLAEIDVEDE